MFQVWGRNNSNHVIHVIWTIGDLQLKYIRHYVKK